MTNKEIQTLLNKALGINLKIDGDIGPKTKEAIKQFQGLKKLKVDGVTGSNTQYELMFYKYPHFKKEEFHCNCHGAYCNGYPVRINENLLVLLEKIREKVGKPILINSAIRCPRYNEKVGGATESQHKYGTAVDIHVAGVSASELYKICDALNPNGGVGKYDTFVHTDVRSGRARWNG